jgi:peptide deformylase
MILPILTIPDKKLRRTAEPVSLELLKKPETQKFIDDLIETMFAKDGVGLAAMQVGSLLNIFCVAAQNGALVMINPEIYKKSWTTEKQEEGCLSVPNVYGLVKRSKNIRLRGLNRRGEIFDAKATGFLARVMQHENDHLNGVIFIDKAKITKGGEELKKMLDK